ncbi:MAG TPA: nucleotidyltransferase domain-containing protein [Thermoanaerobaculia bacterium]
MGVTPEQTLAHLRRLEAERRGRGELRAERLRSRLEGAVRLLRERYGISEARLFGSLVAGDVSGQSDVDLVRIEEASASLRERIDAEGETV